MPQSDPDPVFRRVASAAAFVAGPVESVADQLASVGSRIVAVVAALVIHQAGSQTAAASVVLRASVGFEIAAASLVELHTVVVAAAADNHPALDSSSLAAVVAGSLLLAASDPAFGVLASLHRSCLGHLDSSCLLLR